MRKYASQFIRRRLRLEYTPLNVSVITDEKWLLFVIEQVLSNALKYTRSGSVSITLEAPKTLCIRDTGIGIASEDLPRVFEKGFTGCNGRTDKRATGIGLYLCRRILEKLGHTIAITSTSTRARRCASVCSRTRSRSSEPYRIVSFRRENVSQMHGSHFPGGLY